MTPGNLSREILTPRLRLVAPTLDMADLIFNEVEADRPRLQKFLPWVPFIKTIEDERKWLVSVQEQWSKNSEYNYALLTRDTSEFAGAISFIKVRREYHRGELGYWLVGRFEGKGLMSEAAQALTDEIFHCGFNRAEIRCSMLNKRSAGVPERLGYVHEGTAREEYFVDGRYHDSLIWGKLNPQTHA